MSDQAGKGGPGGAPHGGPSRKGSIHKHMRDLSDKHKADMHDDEIAASLTATPDIKKVTQMIEGDMPVDPAFGKKMLIRTVVQVAARCKAVPSPDQATAELTSQLTSWLDKYGK